MYFWKCWRDARARFVTILLLAMSYMFVTVIGPWNAMHGHPWFSWPVRSRVADSLTRLPGFWRGWILAISVHSIWMVILLGFMFGTSSVGMEFSQNTAEFLLTRPCRRKSFVWSSWLAGISQMSSVLLLLIGAAFGIGVYLTFADWRWQVLVLLVPLCLVAIVMYGLIFLSTTLLRGRKESNLLALAVGLFYHMLNQIFAAVFLPPGRVHLPSPLDAIQPFTALAWGAQHFVFPMLTVIGWTLFAVACPLVAQWYVDRAEV